MTADRGTPAAGAADGWDDLTRLAAQLDGHTRPPPGLPAEQRRAWVAAALRGRTVDPERDADGIGG